MNISATPVVGALTDIHDEELNALGTVRVESGGKEYIYLKGVASTVATDFVTYDEAFATTRLAASAVGPVVVALAAVGAGKYGWYQIRGAASGNVKWDIADNAKCYATAVTGQVDDAAVAGDQIDGAICRSTASNNVSTVQLNYPFIGFTDTDAS